MTDTPAHIPAKAAKPPVETPPSAEAGQIVIQTRQHIVWQLGYDEALIEGIKDVFPDASDDFQASLFALICEQSDFDAKSVQKAIDAANG